MKEGLAMAQRSYVSVWRFALPQGESVGLAGIPMGWDDMGDQMFKEVDLPKQSKEFQKVHAYFGVGTVKAIKRVQNMPLWQPWVSYRWPAIFF